MDRYSTSAGLAPQATDPGNKTFLVVFPTSPLNLVGKQPSSPSQHRFSPPMRDSKPGPQPEETGTLRVEGGGVPTHHFPSSKDSSPTAQESSFPLSLKPSVLLRPASVGLPTDHLPPRRPNSRPCPAQHLPPVWAESPLVFGEPSSALGLPSSALPGRERVLHVSPDPSRFLRQRASTGVTWSMPCFASALAVPVSGESSFSQLGLMSSSKGQP